MKKMDGKSMDIVAENVGKLKELFPEAFTEAKVDFDVLKEVLGEFVDDRDERYSFTWNGKSKARMLAHTPGTGTLRPCKEESVDWNTTQNIFIEGDNLEVLKLLQKSYYKKVKMIYIDPPYNTGNDFVYKDNFKDNIKNYKEITGQIDGNGRNLSNNPETSGRYHTDWLNMMYPRLKLARNLLKDDGVIFISIDDNEVSNLRKMCDEIFGEENFIVNFLWKKKSTTSNVKDAQVSAQVDYQLCYQKSFASKLKQKVQSTEQRSYPNNDNEGNYRTTVIEKKDSGSYKRDTMKFEILGHPPRNGKRWQIGQEKSMELETKNRFIWDGEKVLLKIYDFEDGDTFSAQPNLLDNHGTSDGAARLANNDLFNTPELFDNPKPIELIKHFVDIASNDEDGIVLDFFAGSSSTAHSVFDFNYGCGNTQKFIMVQLPETTDKKSEAYKAGYKTIAEISKERIRRAAAKIKEENFEYEGDLGFKVFKLDSTNIKPWDVDFDSLNEQFLNQMIGNIKSDRSEEDILYEVLLKYGLDLTLPIDEFRMVHGELRMVDHSEQSKIQDQQSKIYSIGMGALIICLSDSISLEVVEGIARLKDELDLEIMRVVFKDSGFADDVVKTNAVQILKQAGIVDVKSL